MHDSLQKESITTTKRKYTFTHFLQGCKIILISDNKRTPWLPRIKHLAKKATKIKGLNSACAQRCFTFSALQMTSWQLPWLSFPLHKHNNPSLQLISHLHLQLTFMLSQIVHLSVWESSLTAFSCYLVGQWGFGAAVWVSVRCEKGSSISGAEVLLENRNMSALDFNLSQNSWRKRGYFGTGGHLSLRCRLRTLEGSPSTHAEIVKEEHDYQSKVPSASDRFNNQSQHRQRKGVYGLHMLYREEKPVIEAAEVPMSSTAKAQKNTNQSPQINV